MRAWEQSWKGPIPRTELKLTSARQDFRLATVQYRHPDFQNARRFERGRDVGLNSVLFQPSALEIIERLGPSPVSDGFTSASSPQGSHRMKPSNDCNWPLAVYRDGPNCSQHHCVSSVTARPLPSPSCWAQTVSLEYFGRRKLAKPRTPSRTLGGLAPDARAASVPRNLRAPSTRCQRAQEQRLVE